MSFNLFALIKLKYILFVTFQNNDYISGSFGLHNLDFVLHYSSFFEKILKPKERFLISKVYVNLAALFNAGYVTNLFFLYDFGCELIIILEKIF